MELPAMLGLCAQPQFVDSGAGTVLPIAEDEPILSPFEMDTARTIRAEIDLCVKEGWLEWQSREKITGFALNGAEYPAFLVRLKITEAGKEQVRRNPLILKHTA